MSNTMSKPGLDPIEHASEDELLYLFGVHAFSFSISSPA